MKQSIYLLLFLFLFIFSACQSQSAENSKLSAQKKGKQATQKQQKDTKNAKWAENAIIYEVNLRHFSEKGTFEGLGKQLGRLKKMGVDVVCLTPIQPIGKKNRQGKLGNPYAVQDFKNVNSNYGKMESFMTLVKRIHQLNMHIIIDWSATAALDSELAQNHKNWFQKDAKKNDVVAFDYENSELQRYMLDAMKYWVKKTDIDGFRCINADAASADFWEKATHDLSTIKPVFMVASNEKSDFKASTFDASYDHTFYALMQDIAAGKKNAEDFNLFLKQEKKSVETARRVRFTKLPSEKTPKNAVFKDFSRTIRSFSVLSYVMSDFPMLQNGQEANLDKYLSLYDKDAIDWNNYELQAFYAQLAKLKHENKALASGNFGGKMQGISSNKANDILAFSRTKDGNKVVAIFNLSNKKISDIEWRINKGIEGKYTDFFSGKEKIFDSKTKMSLEAWEYKIFVFGK
ncbi:MAG: alpha-amylase family glycosyl hydrolase [Chitinophagales bacterium]